MTEDEKRANLNANILYMHHAYVKTTGGSPLRPRGIGDPESKQQNE